MQLGFRYREDEQYFADLLANGSIAKLEKDCFRLFDFRDPKIKRKEFGLKKQQLSPIIIEKAKGICQICKLNAGNEIDHIVPLSSNQLNKKFRKMKPTIVNGKVNKVPAESYGSNDLTNLQLACKSCNRKKWHRF